MYYYISFLRPPSTHISPAAKRIVITPQVANDLRTELYYAEVDLYLSWMPCFQSASSVSAQATRPTKLTTWKPSSAYKEIPVMLPPGVRNGQSWRMVLTADATGGSRIPLLESSCGSLPFPVSSMPILFASTTHERPHKQESIQRMICLAPSLGLGQPPLSVIITEQTSFDLDKKLWDSGIGMSAFIAQLFSAEDLSYKDAPAFPDIKDLLRSLKPVTALELGTGTGVVSIALAALRGKISQLADGSEESVPQEDHILATDLESALPLLHDNISSNHQHAHRGSPRGVELDWDSQTFPSDMADDVERYRTHGLDLILMADVTYNTAAFPALVRMLQKLVDISVTEPLVLLGYKERDPDERSLWGLLEEIGITLTKTNERTGSGGEPVEIWVGRAKKGAHS